MTTCFHEFTGTTPPQEIEIKYWLEGILQRQASACNKQTKYKWQLEYGLDQDHINYVNKKKKGEKDVKWRAVLLKFYIITRREGLREAACQGYEHATSQFWNLVSIVWGRGKRIFGSNSFFTTNFEITGYFASYQVILW